MLKNLLTPKEPTIEDYSKIIYHQLKSFRLNHTDKALVIKNVKAQMQIDLNNEMNDIINANSVQ